MYEYEHYHSEISESKHPCLKKCLFDSRCHYLTINGNVCYYKGETNVNSTERKNCIFDCYNFESEFLKVLMKFFSEWFPY